MQMVDRSGIKARREAIGLTLEEAAKRAGLGDRQRWYGIEHGQRRNISADTLQAVARALDCTMDELMINDKPAMAAQRKSPLGTGRRKRAGGIAT
jgi:transcriptional regulator with XRE-family HTH domain